MWKALCVLLISISVTNAYARTRINTKLAPDSREAAIAIMSDEMNSYPRIEDRIAIFHQSYLAHLDRHTQMTQKMYEAARQLIQEESNEKTEAFFKARDNEKARAALSHDVKLLNQALRTYDFSTAQSSSGAARNVH